MRVSRRLPARIAWLLSIAALASCGPRQPAPVVDGKVWKRLADNCYRIPQWNLAPDHASAGFPFSRSSPPAARAVTLQFSSTAIKQDIAAFELPRTIQGKLLEGESVLLSYPDAAGFAQIRANQKLARESRDNLNLWYAEGDWKQRTIVPSPHAGYFRVSHFPDGHSWRVVTKMPDPVARDAHLAEDFWIGSCHVYEGSTLTSCITHMERDGVYMEYHTTEANLALRAQLAKYFLDTLDGWKISCMDPSN